MSETRQAMLALARLRQAAWPLAASALAIVAVSALSGAPPWLPVVGVASVVAATALLPFRPGGARAQEADVAAGAVDVGSLSAIDLAGAVSDPMIVFDANGAVLHANQAALSAFGDLPVGLVLQIRFRAPEMRDLIARALEGRVTPEPIEYAERGPADRAFRVAATSVGRGRELFVLAFRDQSETRRIDRMRADFIANASHELRTPLASISGFIETLRGPARDDAEARENFLQIMQGQTERMARLIDDLLSLSRLEMRTYVRPTTPVDLRAILLQVVEALAHMARECGVRVEFEPPEGEIVVPGNRDELYQVFQNLLENACKYGASGGRVEILFDDRRAADEQEVAVTIRDHGPGIAEEHIPRITERFYRVDVETSRAQKGTGLGLAIVKHILTRHNGRLSIRSRPREGAAFTVHLPGFGPTGQEARS